MTADTRRFALTDAADACALALFPGISAMFAGAAAVIAISVVLGAAVTVPLVCALAVAVAASALAGKVALALCSSRKVASPSQ